jgi:hypothetical protein
MFYGATVDAVSEGDQQRSRADLMFTHTGGKHRVSMVVRALRGLDVPTNVVTDFDVLREEQPLRSIVEALGGAWNSVEAEWKALKTDVEGRRPDFSRENTIRKIQERLAKSSGDILAKKDDNEIKRILRSASPWAGPKEHGLAFFKGESYALGERLLQKCSAFGLFIVPVGELEGFDRRSGAHGPSWVNDVLQRDLASDPQLSKAREFAKGILEWKAA